MIYLTPAKMDFQSERTLERLLRDLGEEFSITQSTVVNPISTASKLWHHPPSQPVHAWGESALKAAAVCGINRVIYSPPPEIHLPFKFSLRMALWQQSVHVVCPTEAARELFIEQGTPGNRCSVIRPEIDSDRNPAARDEKLRQELGFENADFVTLLCGESTTESEHRTGAWAVSVLHVIDPRYRLLAWGRGSQTTSLIRFGERLEQPKLVTLAQQKLARAVEWEELVSVADAILIPGGGLIATLPISICQASGVPIVARAGPTTSEILANNPNTSLVPDATPKTLAQALLKISENGTARKNAAAEHSSRSTTDQWRDLYRRLGA